MSKPSRERQRELIKQYQEVPKQMGVYCIRNKDTGKHFVAASRDIQARFNRHRYELRTRVERLSEDLQNDWNRLGAEHFEFVVLEALEPLDDADYDPTEDLATLEELWLEKLKPYPPTGYNTIISSELD